ncbi:hypothetical protein DVH05_028573 [Phytophthora capsici]|nr:hypothetical protein DVH05_028573 [Phytophthora capsici]
MQYTSLGTYQPIAQPPPSPVYQFSSGARQCCCSQRPTATSMGLRSLRSGAQYNRKKTGRRQKEGMYWIFGHYHHLSVKIRAVLENNRQTFAKAVNYTSPKFRLLRP